jgi:hypothetical protein
LSASAPPPEQPAPLFIDRCAWSSRLGQALAAAGIAFRHHDELFPQGGADEVWLEGVAGRGWLVVTRDQRIRYKVNEQAAAVRAGLHLFVLTHGGLKAEKTAEIVVTAYPAMCKAAAQHAAPAFFSLHQDGTLSRLKLSGA